MSVASSIQDMFSQWHQHRGALGLVHECVHLQKGSMGALIALGCFSALLGVGSSVLVRDVIDSVGSDLDISELVVYACVLLVGNIVAYFIVLVRSLLGERMQVYLQGKFYRSAVYLDWMKALNYRVGDYSSRMDTDVSQAVGLAAVTFPNVFSSVIQLLAAVAILLFVAPALVVVLFLLAAVSSVVLAIYRARLLPLQEKVRYAETDAESYYTETFGSLLTVKSFNLEQSFAKKWDAASSNRFEAVMNRVRFSTNAGLAFDILRDVGYFIVFAWAAIMLGQGVISFGTLSMLLVLQGYIQGPISSLVASVPKMVWASVSADRLEEIMEGELPENSEQSKDRKSTPLGIRIENVTFSYKPQASPVLDNVSLDITPGQFVALMGNSGAGKTTAVRLVLDLLHPQSGAIFFYDAAGSYPASREMRDSLGYVPQGNTLVSGSILLNVCLGLPKEDPEAAQRALQLADMWDFVQKLPEGMGTLVGEHGIGLSEGQAQRVALARALAIRPAVLILDEASSALDAETERVIYENLKSLSEPPTILCISHRGKVTEYADRVIRLENGKLVDDTARQAESECQ